MERTKYLKYTAIISLILLSLINFKCSSIDAEKKEIRSGSTTVAEVERYEELTALGADLGIYWLVLVFVFVISILGYYITRDERTEEILQGKPIFTEESTIWFVLGVLFIFSGC